MLATDPRALHDSKPVFADPAAAYIAANTFDRPTLVISRAKVARQYDALKGGLGRAITPDLMQHYDRDALRDIVLDGIPGTAMPPWRPLLSEAEALWIADYLRGEVQ